MNVGESFTRRLPASVLLIASSAFAFHGAGAVRAHLNKVRDSLARESLITLTAADKAWGQFDDTTVIGVSIDGRDRAYPVDLPKHVTNDTLADVPIAVSY